MAGKVEVNLRAVKALFESSESKVLSVATIIASMNGPKYYETMIRRLRQEQGFNIVRVNGGYQLVGTSAPGVVRAVDPTKPFPKFKKAGKNKLAVSISSVEVPAEVAVAEAQVIQLVQPNVAGSVSAPKIRLGQASAESLIPDRHPSFVPFGNYSLVNKIIKTGQFYPVFITGLSGNGKTLMVQQACAVNDRECIRVQITPETDEDDLVGGFRLINGETVWFDGPVVIAAQRGAICLVDEIDYGTGKISCLQSILEGKGIFLKKVNRFVAMKPGFNIIATANTKGRGSDENGGRFINTQIMNESFLERFSICLEQGFPNATTEQKILDRELENLNITDSEFTNYLSIWADVIRRSYECGACADLISTRRLVHIVKTYSIFGDKKNAIELCISRFDQQTREGFMQLLDKIMIEPLVTTVAPTDPVDSTEVSASATMATPGAVDLVNGNLATSLDNPNPIDANGIAVSLTDAALGRASASAAVTAANPANTFWGFNR